ncbi:transposable element tc3 transposase [Trichonephila clavipes]|nr:transposable element tc3 transposase [Trichonephila clavipes]
MRSTVVRPTVKLGTGVATRHRFSGVPVLRAASVSGGNENNSRGYLALDILRKVVVPYPRGLREVNFQQGIPRYEERLIVIFRLARSFHLPPNVCNHLVEEDKSSNVLASTSVRHVAEALNLPRSTVQKIMRNILRYYPYKLQFVEELLPHDFETRHLFSLQFLARLEVDPEWSWNILWTDEAHFHLDGSVNTHNCRIWETDNPHSTLRVPLHSPKVTVWCGFSASFILGSYFFEELGAGGPVTCSITGQRYASLLRNKIIPDLQARQCLSRIIFMQDGAPPHITRCVTDVLKYHFTKERVISRQFRHLWPPRSLDLNPCNFWLWGHLKHLVSCDQPKTLPDLKDSISRHVLNISQNTLRSTVEHAILKFQIVAENDGHYVEHLLL